VRREGTATRVIIAAGPSGVSSFGMSARHRLWSIGVPVMSWAITSVVVFVGAALGNYIIRPDKPFAFVDSLACIDGRNYARIAETGYSYRDKEPSNVAFFPAFPLAARLLSRLASTGTFSAQLIISNTCSLVAFMTMWAYMRHRVASLSGVLPHGDGELGSRDLAGYVLLATGVLPTTFFFRVAYSESMFLCVAILTCYAISRKWPVAVISLIAGLATAVRPVGIALLVPLCWYVWKESTSNSQAMRRLAYVIPLGCWGLLAYMVFQYLKFHQPLAFALAQTYHRMRPMGTTSDKWLALLSWEPIRDVYNPASQGYWLALHYSPSRLFSLEFANPIYFIGTAALIALGAWKRWLTSYEILLAVPLLAIPYFTRAYEMRMLSQARFAAVVFPVYIVLGHLLARLPLVVAGALLALSGLMMGLYAALFAAGYPFL